MVEKIYITPGNVRGLGNIVSIKSPTDFTGNYSNLVQDTDGNFILSYEGLLLKFNTTVSNTIKDTVATLNCTVLLEEDNTPVSGLTVTCTFEDETVLSDTTDSNGLVVFNWTPLSIGETSIILHCTQQDDYAAHSSTIDVTVGVLLSINLIMTRLTCEDDEYYLGEFENNIEHRSQLDTYIQNIFIADGGERCVDINGLVFVANPGDLVVEYNNLAQLEGYENVLFDAEVDQLTGAVLGMSINSNDKIILTRLERSDIIGGVSVGLSVSSSSISVGGSVVCTAEVLSDGEPVSGETVSFYDGSTLLGTDETDSDGIATYTATGLSAGTHSLTAEALDKSSSAVTVTVNKLTSTITLSVPASGTVGTSYTVSGTLVPTSGSVKLYENNVLKDTLTVSSGSFSKAITQSNEGTYSYYAVFEGSSTYSSVTSSTGSIVVSDVPPVPVVTSVGLSADKSILSYADSESATLSATVLDQSSTPMSGVTVEFFNGSTSMGTADTNSSGVATKTYASTGAGDLSFTASVGTISSETYEVQDCYLYDTTEHSRTHTSSSAVTNEVISGFSWDNTDDWIFTCELSVSGQGQRIDIVPPSESLSHHLGFGKSTDNNYFRCYIGKTGSGEEWKSSNVNMANGTFYSVQVKKEGTDVEFQYQGNVVDTSAYSTTWLSNYSTETFKFTQWRANSISIRNIKIKPL